MHIFKLKRLVSLLFVVVSCGSAVPVAAFADGGKGEPPAKPAAAAKIEAPAPLTERERWLLDRVEQLEKRVADLESKSNAPTAETAAAEPARASAVAAPTAENASGVANETASAAPPA